MTVTKIEMGTNNHNQTLVNFLSLIEETNSIFCYDNDSEGSKLTEKVIQEMKRKEPLPVIRIYWNEYEKDNFADLDSIASLHVFRNFTSALIKIEKLISKSRHLIFIEDLTKLKHEQNKPYINFLSVLLRKSRENKSPAISMISADERSSLIKNETMPLFENTFVLKNKRIRKTTDDSIDIKYCLNEKGLYLEPYMQNDISKIKEIFSLSQEEKKELDKIVGQSIEEYRSSM
ncbi:MAG: hypothetical protein RBT65_03650 [Methanolobus sp.]|nr:hypothetical protein [Methanolobus sp.]